MKSIKPYVLGLVLASMTLLITSCGGSGSASPAAYAASTTITGSVFAAPVAGATIVVLNSSGTATIAGPVMTHSDGTYSVSIPTAALASDLIFSSSSGTFTDEATGDQTPAGTMSAYVEGGTLTAGLKVHLDPSSTIINGLVTTGTGTSSTNAKATFNTAFGYTPDTSVEPMNTAPTGTTNAPNRLAALRAAAFSKLVHDLILGPDKQFELIAAITQDLSDDGKLNGSAGSLNGTPIPEDIENKFENALVSWLTNTTVNLTGLTPADIAPLPFGKVALTDNYRVEYMPGMMAATASKTTFKLKITNRSDGSAATGLAVSLMPMMHMASMGHSTPVDSVAEEGATGIYDCTAYYLMASGAGMGYWELKVIIGGMMGETATFYPAVGMAMGSDTVRTTLYGPDDIVSSMSGTQYNKYYLFRDGAVTAAASKLDLFISHAESMNMNFVPVSDGSVLSSPTGTVTSMTVQASMDSAFSSPLTAVDNGNGHWSVSPLSGLVSAQTTTIYVKLNVNSQDKTTNGAAASGSNAYATFIVTPQ